MCEILLSCKPGSLPEDDDEDSKLARVLVSISEHFFFYFPFVSQANKVLFMSCDWAESKRKLIVLMII